MSVGEVNEETVTGILVTFNRPELLKLTFASFLNQTHRLFSLVIVDNASDQATFDALKTLKVIPSEQSFLPEPLDIETSVNGIDIHYRRLATNEGGAGGFHEGLKLALKKKSKWFWLMDDDVEATADALEVLLSRRRDSLCIHPAKRYSEGGEIHWEGRFSERSGRTVWNGNASFKRGLHYVSVNYGCFEGMLVHRDIVAKVGLPDKRFFIVNDDLVYGWLASKLTSVMYLNHVGLIKHRPVEAKTSFMGFTENEINPFTQYFNIRNHFLLMEYLTQDGRSKIVLSMFLILKIMKEWLQTSLKKNSKPMRKMIRMGIRDGLNKKFGRPDFV